MEKEKVNGVIIKGVFHEALHGVECLDCSLRDECHSLLVYEMCMTYQSVKDEIDVGFVKRGNVQNIIFEK